MRHTADPQGLARIDGEQANACAKGWAACGTRPTRKGWPGSTVSRQTPAQKEKIAMAYDAQQLLAMSQTQLDDLFRASPAGDIPNGPAAGTAIIAPGTKYSHFIAEVINHF